MTLLPTSALFIAARALHEGKLVGMPTETVYGLAGNALNSAALALIFEVKQRPHFDPLIVHLAAPASTLSSTLTPAWNSWWERLFELEILNSSGLSEKGWILAKTLASAFWPGPLTLVLPKGRAISDLATSGLNTVAIRVPAHPLAQALLSECQLPLAAPSANRFGRISPTTAEHVRQELGDKIPSELAIVLDGGPCSIGVESTVVQVIASDLAPALLLLRPGGVSLDELEKIAGFSVKICSSHGALEEAGLAAPGMLASHYAPKKKMFLVRDASASSDVVGGDLLGASSFLNRSRIGIIHLTNSQSTLMRDFRNQLQTRLPHVTFIETYFSKRSDLSIREAASDIAQNLFSKMREMDESEAEVLIVEHYPNDDGLGAAIRDRLERAATKS